MVAAIDEIVAATCRRRLPRRRRLRAACRSAGGSRRQRRITRRSPLQHRCQHGGHGSSTDHFSNDRCPSTTLAAGRSSGTTGTSTRR